MYGIFKGKIGAALGGLILFVVLIASGILIFEFSYIGQFYPGVVFAGQEIGGLTFSEVENRMALIVERLEREGMVLTVKTNAANYITNIPMSVDGLSSDTIINYFSLGSWRESLMRAYSIGRSNSGLNRIKEQAQSLFLGKRIEIPFIVYESSLRAFLVRETENILSKERLASYIFKEGVWQISPEKSGEKIDVGFVVDQLQESLTKITDNKLEVESIFTQPTTDEIRLAEYLDFVVNSVVPVVFRFKYNGYNAYLSGNALALWLEIDPDKKGDFTLGVNFFKIESFIRSKLGIYLENPVQNSRFDWRGGELVEITLGLEGSAIDIDNLVLGIGEFLEREYRNYIVPIIGQKKKRSFVLDINVKTEAPRITKETINQYDIRELVATAQTSFRGSGSARIHNIRLAASKLNGLLIAPGEEFSAVNSIGYVTEEEGYEKEYVIKGNESVKELGGGLCQLATTLFRVALNGGLDITERQNHSYVVGYYGPGLDATIYGPHPDFRFINDTGHYLLLQSRADGTSLVFELYGQKDGRVASVSEPEIYDRVVPPAPKYVASDELSLGAIKCTEKARYGMTTEATYMVEYLDGTMKKKVFKSIYRPWRKVCLIGTRTY